MANKELAEKIALEGVVLLKNEAALPLINKKIALFGSGARFTTKGGTGSGDVNVFHSVSVEEGLINSGCEILSTYYLDECEERLKLAIKDRNRNIKNMSTSLYY